MKRVLLALVLSIPTLAAGCGSSEDSQTAASTEPIVGVLELPLSHRNGGAAPTEAYRVEVGPAELRMDGRPVIALEQGRIPAAERGGEVITKLHSGINSGPAKRRAAIRMHVNTPWETTVWLMRTLERANVREAAFEVRKPGTQSDTGWLVFEGFRVTPAGTEPPTFDAAFQRPWGEFVGGWLASYDSCRGAEYVDCDPVPVIAAQGGNALITLRSRGSAVKIEFSRVGGPPIPEGPAPPPPMIEGVPSPVPSDEIPPPPVVEAVFTFRAEATTAVDSDIAGVTRTMCGARPCSVVAIADPETLSMRILSLFGAAFPDGSTAPQVVFQLP